ncbi:ArsA family ATPase [Prosthecochloris sp. N3]|uniref:arsenite-transporting ATPase n=1 Tax=Prosthecochloris ethylica TaxID=2743976 RepID=A0ABR9XNT2_9CHLB|nr:ArsA family ATPase [Prosthecochloris ethylica]MBF0585776.1 ArsA family ATPase [Prosthecochloris ethylica]MBF0635686.1 ArsA family ATPase [Prosthecochloris ethylica]MEC9486523.1 ArsA family ATPase [Prosthecochloris sp.]NUK46985.1 ArsA family ATPase [Prosthecochloris ethylica]
MRIILYLGKGGVGKTTVSASTATAIARSGKRVLIMSTDVAHSLADALGVELSPTPVEVEKNLFAMEVNVLSEIRENWTELYSYFSSILMNDGASEVVAEELAVVPGMEEMISLRYIWKAAKSGLYDAIVVDAAPTGETMRLLGMPESYGWYSEKIGGWHSKAIGFAAPLLNRFMPKKNIFKLMPEVNDHMKELHGMLQDKDITTFRVVVNPENMVIKEALRVQTYLNLFGYKLDAVIVNKILPQESSDEYLRNLIDMQKKYLKVIDDCFYPIPIFKASQSSREVIKTEQLYQLSQQLFDSHNPIEVLYDNDKTQSLEKIDGKYVLKLHLPNVEITKLNVNIKGDELLVDINNFRKSIVLPNILVGRKTEGADFEEGHLNITFAN